MTEVREDLLDGLSEDTKDFWVDARVPVLHNPTAAQFLREAVCRYHPVLINGLIDDWPALRKWNKDYLIQAIGDRKVNVNLTSDGHGDCVKDIFRVDANTANETSPVSVGHFVYPAEHDMTMAEFYNLIENRQDNYESNSIDCVPVPYLSQQNDNLRQNMPELLQDIQTSLPLAVEAFGSSDSTSMYNIEEGDDNFIPSGALEAVNLWIGDERSVSSIHKDHYENMYAVVSGEKIFTLLPPTDVAFLAPYTKEYPTLRYAVRGGSDTTGASTSSISSEGQQDKYFESALEAAQYTSNALQNSCEVSDDGNTSNLQLELTKNGCPTETLEWTPVDPEDPDVSTKYPLFLRATPLRVKVLPGQVLYIPAMWYHRVSQTCLTVSVNYWHDQKFDFRYVFYQSIKRLHNQEETSADADI